MLDYRESWKAIAARILGLAKAADIYIQASKVNTDDSQGISKKVIQPHSIQIAEDIIQFQSRFNDVLPQPIRNTIQRFHEELEPAIKYDGKRDVVAVKTNLAILLSLEAEISYHLSDIEETAHRLTERAFGHLQRLLLVDDDYRDKWEKAFRKGETACERLGAVHLLHHGIYAFKAHAEKGWTDLIMGEPINQSNPLIRSSDALVLSEWKVVNHDGDLEKKAAQAQGQLQLYSEGTLLGIELRSYQYVILVSEKPLPQLEDVIVDRIVTIRHINLCVRQQVPSKTATRVRKKSDK